MEDDGDWMLVHSAESDDDDDSMSLVPVSRNQFMDNSWFMTPAPIYQGGSISDIDISPLGELRIEAPTTYHLENQAAPKIGKGGSGVQTKSKKSVTIKEPYNKINDVIRDLQNETQGQKMMQWQQVKFVHMKQLERQNKVQDYQSKNQRQRRKDHSNRHSGRSNDRKCC